MVKKHLIVAHELFLSNMNCYSNRFDVIFSITGLITCKKLRQCNAKLLYVRPHVFKMLDNTRCYPRIISPIIFWMPISQIWKYAAHRIHKNLSRLIDADDWIVRDLSPCPRKMIPHVLSLPIVENVVLVLFGDVGWSEWGWVYICEHIWWQWRSETDVFRTHISFVWRILACVTFGGTKTRRKPIKGARMAYLVGLIGNNLCLSPPRFQKFCYEKKKLW